MIGRRVVAGLVPALLVLALPAAARADPAGDERYMRLEHAERSFAQMPNLAQMQGPMIEVADRQQLPALIKRGATAMTQAFAPQPARAAMQAALGRVPGDVPADLTAITARMEAVEAEITHLSLAQAQAREAEFRTHYEARPDRSAIDAVSNAMVAPELAGEVAVTGRRVKAIYEAVITGSPDELRDMTPKQIDDSITGLLDSGRIADENYGPVPLRPDFMRKQRQLFTRTMLSRLPQADVATLARFYASPVGRAKRAALLASFRRCNDDGGRRFIKQMVDEQLAIVRGVDAS